MTQGKRTSDVSSRGSVVWWLMAAAAATLAVGCTDGGSDSSGDGQPSTEAAASDADPEDEDGDGAQAADGPTAEGRLDLEGWVELHPNNSSLTLTDIEVDEAGDLFVGIESVVVSSRLVSSIDLARDRTELIDDLGNVYPLVPPEDDPRIRAEGDAQLTATLAFEGPVAPGAQRVDVVFNQPGDDGVTPTGGDDDATAGAPVFAFDGVPLPGVGVDDEAVVGGPTVLDERTFEIGLSETVYDGVEVVVEQVTTDGQSLTIEMSFANPTDRGAMLTASSPDLEGVGVDTSFGFLRIDSDDTSDRVLNLRPGEEASAVLAFTGAVASDLEALLLTMNPGQGSSDAGAIQEEFEIGPIELEGGS